VVGEVVGYGDEDVEYESTVNVQTLDEYPREHDRLGELHAADEQLADHYLHNRYVICRQLNQAGYFTARRTRTMLGVDSVSTGSNAIAYVRPFVRLFRFNSKLV